MIGVGFCLSFPLNNFLLVESEVWNSSRWPELLLFTFSDIVGRDRRASFDLWLASIVPERVTAH